MTDNDIIKALECCANCESCDYETTDCPLGKEMECRSLLAEFALVLINRQKAEIERLKQDRYLVKENGDIELLPRTEFKARIQVEDMVVCASSLGEWLEFCDTLKAEAIKEFANRLSSSFSLSAGIFTLGTVHYKIDNLVKEMVGDTDESTKNS